MPEQAEELLRCHSCNMEITADDAIEGGGEIYCEMCWCDLFRICDGCGETCEIDNCTVINDSCFCDTCRDRRFVICSDCDEWAPRGDASEYGGGYVCAGCYDDHYFTCEECGDVTHNDNMSSRDDMYVCEDCAPATRILRYAHTTARRFYGSSNEDPALYLGVELEVDNGNDAASTAEEILEDFSDKLECKNDGSLDAGFEIATQPATLLYHEKEFGWEEIIKILTENKWRSHDTQTCGLHVHVSRNYLQIVDQIKIAAFVNLLPDVHQKIARRGPSTYAKFKNVKNKLLDVPHSADRYEAVNYCNRRTVEFRLFRGTLVLDTLYATLEYCDSICRFVKREPINTFLLPNFAWDRYVKFLKDDKSYTYLERYLKDKEII